MTDVGADRSGVTCSGMDFRYGSRVASDDVSLRAPAGSVVGLIGPEGAGKTTLIRLLTTILPLQTGTFRVAGCQHTDPIGIRHRIGVLPESSGFPRSTTGEGCASPARWRYAGFAGGRRETATYVSAVSTMTTAP